MDLEKIEISKKIFKSSGFRNSKTLNFYKNVIHIFSKPFASRIVNYSWMRRCFEKNGGAKVFDLKQKKSVWKKNRGFEGSGPVEIRFFYPCSKQNLCPLF